LTKLGAAILAGRCGPSNRVTVGVHVDRDLHAKIILSFSPIASKEGDGLLWRSGNSYADEIAITDYPVRRIEFYPP
jgi:hypothetical protein